MPNILDATGAAYPARNMAPGVRRISGTIYTNGSSAIATTASADASGRWSAVRTSQGLITVTVTDGVYAGSVGGYSIQTTTATALYPQVGAVAITSGSMTVAFRMIDASGIAQDLAADAGNAINFSLVVRGSERAV